MFVCTKVNILYEISANEVIKFDELWVELVSYVTIEVIDDNAFMRGDGCT